jgi:hypothetical protein
VTGQVVGKTREKIWMKQKISLPWKERLKNVDDAGMC